MLSENRYQLYHFCKEAINNAVKYSNGNLLELIVKESNQLLQITISDNTKGFKAASVKRGNGLDYMEREPMNWGPILYAIKTGRRLFIRAKSKNHPMRYCSYRFNCAFWGIFG